MVVNVTRSSSPRILSTLSSWCSCFILPNSPVFIKWVPHSGRLMETVESSLQLHWVWTLEWMSRWSRTGTMTLRTSPDDHPWVLRCEPCQQGNRSPQTCALLTGYFIFYFYFFCGWLFFLYFFLKKMCASLSLSLSLYKLFGYFVI